jgi:hypothetical protein
MANLKKTLPMGVGAGVGVAAGLVFLLDTLLRLRRQRREAAETIRDEGLEIELEGPESDLDAADGRRVAVNGAHPTAAIRRAGRYPRSRPFRTR